MAIINTNLFENILKTLLKVLLSTLQIPVLFKLLFVCSESKRVHKKKLKVIRSMQVYCPIIIGFKF